MATITGLCHRSHKYAEVGSGSCLALARASHIWEIAQPQIRLAVMDKAMEMGGDPFFKDLNYAAQHKFAAHMLSGRARPFDPTFFSDPKDPLMVIDALFMYDQNLLTKENLAQIMLVYALSSEEGFTLYQENTEELLLAKFFSARPGDHARWLEHLEQAVRQAVASVDPVDRILVSVKRNKDTMPEKLFEAFQSRRFMPDCCTDVLCIPPKLFGALLKELFRSNAVLPEPVLSQPKIPRFSDISKRVMSISIPEHPLMDIHGWKGKTHSMVYFHDMYHLLLESGNPYRAEYVKIANMLKELEKEVKDQKTRAFLSALRICFLDRDIGFTDQYTQFPDPMKLPQEIGNSANLTDRHPTLFFWRGVVQCVCLTFAKHAGKQREYLPAILLFTKKLKSMTSLDPALAAYLPQYSAILRRSYDDFCDEDMGLLESSEAVPSFATAAAAAATAERY